jgi:hypothetical protein
MASSAQIEKIDIGRVIQRGFNTIGRNAATFLLAGVIFAGLPTFVAQYVAVSQFRSGPPQFGADFLAASAIMFIVSIFASNLLQATLVRSSILDLNGRPADIGGSLQAAFMIILPMIGLTIVASIGIGLGLLLLIVPGIILYVMWIVAVPVLVEERVGVFESLGRSASLTAGSRWRIFGLLVLYVLFWWIVALVFQLVFAFDPLDGATYMALVNALIGIVTGVFTATMTASLYVELRTVKEGATAESLASIFD